MHVFQGWSLEDNSSSCLGRCRFSAMDALLERKAENNESLDGDEQFFPTLDR